MKIAVKEVGKELQIIETSEKYRSDCVRAFIGADATPGFVILNKDNTLSFGVNEDGLPLELPLNFLIETNNPHYPIQKIVGTAVFVRCKYANPWVEEIWDFEVEDLKDEDLVIIKRMLDIKYQNVLAKRFEDYGTGTAIFSIF